MSGTERQGDGQESERDAERGRGAQRVFEPFSRHICCTPGMQCRWLARRAARDADASASPRWSPLPFSSAAAARHPSTTAAAGGAPLASGPRPLALDASAASRRRGLRRALTHARAEEWWRPTDAGSCALETTTPRRAGRAPTRWRAERSPCERGLGFARALPKASRRPRWAHAAAPRGRCESSSASRAEGAQRPGANLPFDRVATPPSSAASRGRARARRVETFGAEPRFCFESESAGQNLQSARRGARFFPTVRLSAFACEDGFAPREHPNEWK